MIWTLLILVGAFYDVVNLALVREYFLGRSSSPVNYPVFFYLAGITCAIWFTSHRTEWIGVVSGSKLLVAHFLILSFWSRSRVVRKRDEWMKQLEEEAKAEYQNRLRTEALRNTMSDIKENQAPWLSRD